MLPTESAIAAAKARRETARRLGINSSMDNTASSDFISLEIGPVTSKRESRLVREEDEIGEGEDDHAEFTGANERIPLGKKPKAALEKRRKEGILEAIDLMDEDMLEGEEDEEARKWELAQIRRGEQRRQKDEDLEKEPYRAAASEWSTAYLTAYAPFQLTESASLLLPHSPRGFEPAEPV